MKETEEETEEGRDVMVRDEVGSSDEWLLLYDKEGRI